MIWPFSKQPRFGKAGSGPIWKTKVMKSLRIMIMRRRADGALAAIAGYGKVMKEGGREYVEGILETKDKVRLPYPPYESVIPTPNGDLVIYYEPEGEVYYPIVSARAVGELNSDEIAVLEPKASFPAKDEYIAAREDAERMWNKRSFVEKWGPVLSLGTVVVISVILTLMLFKGFTDAIAPLTDIASQINAASNNLAEAIKVARGISGSAP